MIFLGEHDCDGGGCRLHVETSSWQTMEKLVEALTHMEERKFDM